MKSINLNTITIDNNLYPKLGYVTHLKKIYENDKIHLLEQSQRECIYQFKKKENI